MIKKFKKAILTVGFICGAVVGINGGHASADLIDMPGRVTYYADKFVGKPGAVGTIVGPNVCAVDNDLYNIIPKATLMVTKNKDNGKVHTFYKHDYGYFAAGYVLDITPADFTGKMGGSLSKGYFNGNVTYFLE